MQTKKFSPILIIFLCLTVILTFMLSSCRIIKNDFLDDQLTTFMEHLEKDNREAALSMIHPSVRSEFNGTYDQIREYWPVSRNDKFTLTYINVNISGGIKTYRGTYKVTSSGEVYHIDLTYIDNGAGKGISSFHVISDAEYDEAENQQSVIPSSILLIIRLLIFGFMVFTIVDICLKKPRLYGWWIVLALICIGAGIQFSNEEIRFSFLVNIFPSLFITNNTHLTAYGMTLPVGTILYWCLRKILLRKKAEQVAAQAKVSENTSVTAEEIPPVPSTNHPSESNLGNTTENPAEDSPRDT